MYVAAEANITDEKKNVTDVADKTAVSDQGLTQHD